MKCPKCGSNNCVTGIAVGYLLYCEDCNKHYNLEQQSEIEELKEDIENYKAMKEGVTERIGDLERQLISKDRTIKNHLKTISMITSDPNVTEVIKANSELVGANETLREQIEALKKELFNERRIKDAS